MRFFFVVVLVGLAPGCTSGTRPNPNFCCLSLEDCDSVGVNELRECIVGERCESHECIAAVCTSSAECGAEHPLCSNGVCVDCDSTHGCPSPDRAFCDLAIGGCGPCGTSSECGAFPAAPACVDGACVQCATSNDCGAATAPICEGGMCRGCKQDSECETTACGDDGTCIAEAAIVWMAVNGGSTTCTRAAPCANFTEAGAQLSAVRKHIVMSTGTYPTPRFIVGSSVPSADLTIHANGSTIQPTTTTTGAFQVNSGKTLILKNATVSGVSTSNAMIVLAGGTLRLDSVTISDAMPLMIEGQVLGRDLRFSSARGTSAIDLQSSEPSLRSTAARSPAVPSASTRAVSSRRRCT